MKWFAKLLLAAMVAACAVALAGCAGGTTYDESGSPPADTGAAAGHAGHGGGGAGSEHAGHGGAAAGDGPGATGEMAVLARTETSDLAVELHAMAPELFYVSEGEGLRPQRPSRGDDVHLMVTLADRESGVRLPDATVTARVVAQGGATVFEGPLYPMVGRGMGLHYGENVPLGRPGRYDVTLVIGPPRIGRHRAVRDAWDETTRVERSFAFDGTTVRAE